MSFRFKQFYVDDDRCAMKVGTDGVLLGCWCPTPHLTFDIGHLRILDIGTGSGLIALMLAQRCTDAHIDAIDIDAEAAAQAAENFASSPWSERLHAHHCSLQEWRPEEKYHLIVSNPPYFQNSLKNPDKGREMNCSAGVQTYWPRTVNWRLSYRQKQKRKYAAWLPQKDSR